MASADLKVLADSVIKTAGLGEAFDEQNTAHAVHLQEFAKKAQETCVANWHRATHVEKVASRAAVREAYGTLSRLEKWAAVLEKTARLSPAQHEQIYQAAMDRDDISRDIFRRHVAAALPAVGVGATTAGLAGAALAHGLSNGNAYVSVPVGIATGLLGAGTGLLAAGNAARNDVIDHQLSRWALRQAPAQVQQKVAALPPHLEEPLFQYALANDPTSRAEYMARRRELYPLTLAGAITGGLAAGVPLYRTAGSAAGLGGAVAGTLAAGYFANSAAAHAAKRQVLDSVLARAAHYSALQPEPPRLTSG